MKSVLALLILVSSFASAAHAGARTIKGDEAEQVVRALEIIAGGAFDDSGLEFFSGSTNESLVGDEVSDHWQQFSGKVGTKSVDCESHEFMTFKVSKKNKNAYKDSFECTIK